jgi:hypothetical protein
MVRRRAALADRGTQTPSRERPKVEFAPVAVGGRVLLLL